MPRHQSQDEKATYDLINAIYEGWPSHLEEARLLINMMKLQQQSWREIKVALIKFLCKKVMEEE